MESQANKIIAIPLWLDLLFLFEGVLGHIILRGYFWLFD